jgi:hypothetical protein
VLVFVRHAVPHTQWPGGPDDLRRGLTTEGHARAAALVEPLARPSGGRPKPPPEAGRRCPS